MKTVLVTGANSGFGYLIALKFARNGWQVFATTRDLEKDGVKDMDRVAKEENLKVSWLVVDVTDKETIKRAAEKVKESAGGLDVLVNNAGFGIIGPIESYTTDDFRKQFETNLFGVVETTYAFLPLLKKSSEGKIINISSIAGLTAAPAYGLYGSSKHALEIYTETLRYELSDTNVRVALIEPGGFETNFGKNAAGLQAGSKVDNWFEKAKKIRESTLIGGKDGLLARSRNPQRVADRVFSVANKRNPKLRNVLGSGAPIMAVLRRILPDFIWEFVIVSIMKWLRK
jgi:NAD(P)-dependent dehydrogenase (short-subunit alcohol dehydrogenase family)